MRLGDMLLKAGVVTELQLNAATAEQERWGGKLGRILVRMGALSEELLVMALARQLNLPRADLTSVVSIPEALKARMPLDYCERYSAIPLAWIADRRVVQVAMSNPLDVKAVDDLTRLLGGNLEIFVAGDDDIDGAIRRCYAAAPSSSVSGTSSSEGERMELVDNAGNVVPADALPRRATVSSPRVAAVSTAPTPVSSSSLPRTRTDTAPASNGLPRTRTNSAPSPAPASGGMPRTTTAAGSAPNAGTGGGLPRSPTRSTTVATLDPAVAARIAEHALAVRAVAELLFARGLVPSSFVRSR